MAIVRADSAGAFSVDLVLLVDLKAGTCLYVTNGPDNPTMTAPLGTIKAQDGTGTLEFCVPGQGMARGSIVSFPSNPNWRATEAGITFDDQLFVFQYDLSLAEDTLSFAQQARDREVVLWHFQQDSVCDLQIAAAFPVPAATTCLLANTPTVVYRGPTEGDKPSLVKALVDHLFWFGSSSSQPVVSGFVIGACCCSPLLRAGS